MKALLSRHTWRTEKHMRNEGCSPQMSYSRWAEQVLFLQLCVCVCEWVHVAGPDDSDWVIQGRVCALSVCLLFYSHMDLRPLMKSARLPDPALGSSHINSSQQKCSGSLLAQNLNEPAYGFRRMQMRSGSHFPSLTSRLAVRTHMFGGKMWPFRERTTRGWKRSPVLNSILGVWGGL